MTPRYKHYRVIYHWFRTRLKPNEIGMDRIDTQLRRELTFSPNLSGQNLRSQQKIDHGMIAISSRLRGSA
jgi:hypothetical protein